METRILSKESSTAEVEIEFQFVTDCSHHLSSAPCYKIKDPPGLCERLKKVKNGI